MSVITVSRGSYSRGKEIAEKLAARLGYECVSRDSLFDDVAELDARDAKLIRSVEDIPSIFSRLQFGKETYIAYIQAALLQRLKQDDVVYEGFVGHVFFRDIPNVLKVRVISDYEDRTNIVAERDGISSDQALKFVKKIDEQRRRWSQYLYGVDPADPDQYDLVVNVKQIPVDAVVDALVRISGLEQFRLTGEAKQKMEDLALAAQIRNTLLRRHAGVEVSAQDGKVFVSAEVSSHGKAELVAEIERLAQSVPEIREIDTEFSVTVPLSRERVTETLTVTP